MSRSGRGTRALLFAFVVATVLGVLDPAPAGASSKRRSVVIATCSFGYRVAAMDDRHEPGVSDASCMIRNRALLDASPRPTMTYSGRCIPARYRSWRIEAGTFARLDYGYFIEWRWTIGSDGTHWVDFGTEPQAGYPDCLITARLWS